MKIKSAEIESQEWYLALVDECKSIITESVANSRWDLIEGYHTLGKTIATDKNFIKSAHGNRQSLQRLANFIGISDRTMYYALKVFEKYPNINTLPEGKNISWHKLVKNYLGAPKEEKDEEPKCKNCPIHCHE